MIKEEYEVLLYYMYTDIDDVDAFRKEQYDLCKSLGLLGRIIVSKEGINGTVSGLKESTQTYCDLMKADPRFKGIAFKIDEVDEHKFPKLKVKVKRELVNLSLGRDVNPLETTGNYLKPTEFYQHMQEENTIVLDARNDYEYDLGHFRNAIRPDITVFRDLPKWISTNKELLEGKKILTYCTGGVRCEKFSGWLKEEGFEDVNQLEGGIVTYGYDKDVQGELWDGQCYVFDQRIAVPINRVSPSIVGKDFFTQEPCERYINCANPTCNRQMLCSKENEEKYMGSCSEACYLSDTNRNAVRQSLNETEILSLNPFTV